MNNLVCMAKIISTHGVKGAVKLKLFSEHIKDYREFIISGSTTYIKISVQSIINGVALAYFDGIDDVDHAKKIVGLKVYVSRDALPVVPSTHEFYIHDLMGLDVVDASHTTIGKVIAVHNFGAGDILEIKFSAKNNTDMMLFSKHLFPEIDLQSKIIRINSTSVAKNIK